MAGNLEIIVDEQHPHGKQQWVYRQRENEQDGRCHQQPLEMAVAPLGKYLQAGNRSGLLHVANLCHAAVSISSRPKRKVACPPDMADTPLTFLNAQTQSSFTAMPSFSTV